MQALLRIGLASVMLLGITARDAGAKEPEPAKGTRVVLLDPVAGSDGDAKARKTLHAALTKHLKARGFAVAASGSPRFRLSPSLVRLDVVRKSSYVEVTARTAVMFVHHGKVDGGYERTASVRTESPKASPARLTNSALEAAAQALAKDAAERIAELR